MLEMIVPANHLKPVFLTNHLGDTSKTHITTSDNTKNLNNN